MEVKEKTDTTQCQQTLAINEHCIDIKNILIVEDQEFLLLHIQQKLSETFSINCDIAATENEAKTLLEQKNYDLVILDIYLPDSTGNFVGCLIRKNSRIILITGRDTEENRSKLVNLPIVDYIYKTDERTLINYLVESINRLQINCKTTIAICDDSKVSRLKTIDILKKQNLAYIELSDGKMAHQCIIEQGIKADLLITDVHMPIMNGEDLVRLLRLEFSKNELPILAFSSSEKSSTVSQLLKLGANDFISKPINNEEFLIRLNSTLDQHRLHKDNLKLIEELKKASTTDHLTQLYNRSFFYDSFKHVFAQAKRENRTYGIMMIDIDHFKRVNDTYGHDAGDITLKTVADLIKNNQRDSDIVCRWGGEEFIILIQKTTLTQIVQFAERLRTTIANTPIVIEPKLLEFSITSSFGVAIGMDENVDNTINLADSFLYKAKKAGRNQIAFK